MKKAAILILLNTISFIGLGQSNQENVNEFLDSMNCKEMISKIFNELESRILSNKEQIFKEYELDINNQTDVNTFETKLTELIKKGKEDTYNYMESNYLNNYSDEQIINFLNIINDKIDIYTVESNFKDELSSILKYQMSYFSKNMNSTFIELRSKYRPLKLEVYSNNKKISLSELNLNLILNTNNKTRSKISILNKSNSEITIPDNFDYNTIESLTIQLNNKEYTIEKYPNNQITELSEIVNPLTKECFEDLETWTLSINEKKVHLKMIHETIFNK